MPALLITSSAPTGAEYVALNFRLWRRARRTRLNHWVLGAAGALLAGSIGLDVVRTGAITDWLPVVWLGLALGYGLARGPLVRWQLRRLYARNPALHTPARFALSPEGLRGQGELGQFDSRWPGIRRAVWVRPHWLLLYPTEAACHYLDLRRLAPPATPTEVLALLRAQGVPVQEA